jgi:bifunctional non-homologous end joining protein LigD
LIATAEPPEDGDHVDVTVAADAGLHVSAHATRLANARILTMASKRPAPVRVSLSNPDKVLFPDDGITKADLADYYERVAEVMVPHVKNRPMNLWRWNKGIAHDVVIQQSLPKGAPEWVARCEVPRRKGGDITHGMINDAETLRWLAQQNCITPHVWNARCDLRDKPDRLVFDLDPTGEDFDEIRAAALAVAELLRGLGLVPFAKLSGSRGIHVVAPLKRTRLADDVREAAQVLADRIAAEHPDTLTTQWRKEKRDGKILVDVARNTYGQTVVAPYAVRALPGAPISAPVTWDEVADPELTAHAFTLRTIDERLKAVGDPWQDLDAQAKTLAKDLSKA